jgi:hypothetical protein
MDLLLDYVPRSCQAHPIFELLKSYLARLYMRLSQWDYLVFRKELLFHPFPQNILVRREPIVFNPKVEGHKVHKENTE